MSSVLSELVAYLNLHNDDDHFNLAAAPSTLGDEQDGASAAESHWTEPRSGSSYPVPSVSPVHLAGERDSGSPLMRKMPGPTTQPMQERRGGPSEAASFERRIHDVLRLIQQARRNLGDSSEDLDDLHHHAAASPSSLAASSPERRPAGGIGAFSMSYEGKAGAGAGGNSSMSGGKTSSVRPSSTSTSTTYGMAPPVHGALPGGRQGSDRSPTDGHESVALAEGAFLHPVDDPFGAVTSKRGIRHGQPARTRKPIRAILDGIQHRMQLLQSNPVEMNKFLNIIEGYRLEELQALAGQDNIVNRNRDALKSYSPHTVEQARREHASAEKEKMSRALASHASQLEASLISTRAKVAAEDAAYEAHLKHRAQAAQLAAYRQHQRKYALIVLLGSRLFLISHLLHAHHVRSLERLRQSHAARVIQRQVRIWSTRRAEVRREAAMDALAVHLGKVIRQRRLRHLNDAADIIRDFLQEAKESSRLLEVIRQWRSKVLLGQRLIRHHLAWMHASRELLQLQWERYEPLWWDRKLRSALASAKGRSSNKVGARGTTPSSGIKKPVTPSNASAKQIPGKSTTKLSKMIDSRASIPIEIRDQMLEMDLQTRRRIYYHQFGIWNAQMQAWRKHKAEMESARASLHIDGSGKNQISDPPVTTNPSAALHFAQDGTPLRLHFRALLSEAEMFALMDQAFTTMQERIQTPATA